MKLFQLPIRITLILVWFLLANNPVRSQSGNMSDITMPNPGEVAPNTPEPETPDAETPPENITAETSESETPDVDTPPEDITAETPEPETPDVDTPDGESTPTENTTAETPEPETPDVDTPPEDITAETPEPETPDVDTPPEDITAETPEPETPDVDTPPEDITAETPEPETPDGEGIPEDITAETPEPETPDGEGIPEDITAETPEPETPDVDAPPEDITAETPEPETPDGEETPPEDITAETPEPETPDGESTPPEDITAETPEPETPDETPIEENIAGDENIPSEEALVEEDIETPNENVIAEKDLETPRNNAINDDNEITERNAVNENIINAIADGNSEPEIITNEDDFGVTLTENAADNTDISTNTENNVIPDVANENSNTNLETSNESIVETETNLDINNDDSSQVVIEDSLEQNMETVTEVDSSSPTPSKNSDTATETETVTVEETATVDTPTETETITPEETATVDTPTETETETVEETATVDTPTETETITPEETAAKDEVIEELAEKIEEESVAAIDEVEEKIELSEEKGEAIETAEDTEEIADDTEEAAEDTEEIEEEVAEDSESPQDLGQEVDRIAYEVQVQESPTDLAIQMQEELQLTQLMDTSGLQIYGQVPSVTEISNRLAELGQQTGKNPAFINVSLQSNQLESFVVLPNEVQSANKEHSLVASTQLNKVNSSKTSQASTLRKTVADTSRKELIATATKFREEISDSSKLDRSSYMQSAQELYRVLIEPIEAELAANNIDILVFSMDSGLRLLPLAALHDGEQFLIEKYAVAIVPSFGLTDTRYVSLEQSSILAMGASEFAEQATLPTMPIELETIVSQPRQGEMFINEQFTIENFKAQNKRENPFPIVHLGTHAEFKAGSLNDSYIQFYDDKLKIPELQNLSNELGWNSDATPIELLVLSACETALGDEEAELGFAGLAVQAGVKSALASLWYVSDIGTLALMGEFYDQLGGTLVKAEALRQTQLKMLQGNVRVNDRQVELSNGQNLDLPPEFPNGTLTLDHPYFWSSFTLIGNWN